MWLAKDPHRDIAGRIDHVQSTLVWLPRISQNIPNIAIFATVWVIPWLLPQYNVKRLRMHGVIYFITWNIELFSYP